MGKTAQEIINDIESHFKNLVRTKNFSDLYIGITNDIERRLFSEHNVPKQNHWFITRVAVNNEHARSVEKYYLDKGMKGGGGGGDYTAKYIYCYEIANFTNE
ncbi:MAG: hypothetical protein PHO80_02805 [Candidatus Gracilibacteria bacterium]|nr:hypothetical protein [Candidatus Gracilibacteria bacterium]